MFSINPIHRTDNAISVHYWLKRKEINETMIENIILGGLLVVILGVLILILRHLSVVKHQTENTAQDALGSLHADVSRSEREIKEEMRSNQRAVDNMLTSRLQSATETLVGTLGTLGDAQAHQLTNATQAINDLASSNKTSIEAVRTSVDTRLQSLQENNESKLEQIRETVDERLQTTLERRITESFKTVSERLEAVQRAAGTMQNLAAEVGDVKRVLANVSTRGVLGETQLGAILEEILTPDQYSKNVQPHAGAERVEFAIRLPGNNGDPNSCVWLPIDSKFPIIADYERIVDAADKADKDAEKKAISSFIGRVKTEAKRINEKYISTPETTEFAIMFLPTEGLYSEILRQPGQVGELLQNQRIIVAGPTNLAAIVISIRVGFQTLAIQKHSGEIAEVLGAVKTEFDKFDDVLNKLERQLRTATSTVEKVGTRKRAMVRKLSEVEKLPQEEAARKIGLPSSESSDALTE